MPRLTADQCRAARALLNWSQGQLADKSRVSRETITAFERGKAQPFDRTLDDLIEALHEAGIDLIDGADDGTGHGVRWRKGVGPAKISARKGKGTTGQDDAKGGLDALDWDWESESVEDDEPLPPLDWTDEDRADQIEHWRSRPEAWARLHEVSRQCLLRAMGVDSLSAGDSAP
jgi:transcriptional regulator with XRE-family HTH domain